MVGRWPARKFIWGLAGLFTVWILVDVLYLGGTTRLARATYDAMVRMRVTTRPPDPRIVVVDIDEESLVRMAPTFGRWPWPRDTLATVLDHLEQRAPAAIAWDILFADRDALNPGGDAAFDAAAARSARSHFSVVRLPAELDHRSHLRQAALPSLWVAPGGGQASVALIPPVLKSVAAGRLGYNNGYPDADGVVRRYRFAEVLPDGGILSSTALSVARAVAPDAAATLLRRLDSGFFPADALLTWRDRPIPYPRIPFWKLFEEAEGGAAAGMDWAGKVVVIGSTAPSLHDIHPSPLDRTHPGVFILATAIDNALHAEQLGELPKGVLAAIAIALCAAAACWVQFRSVTTLEPLLVVAPALLLAVSFLSLHGAPVFLELQVGAGLALMFLLALRTFSSMRRQHWCSPPRRTGDGTALWAVARSRAWSPRAIERLMDVLERHAPQCRILVADATPRWWGEARWPELARFAAIVGPAHAFQPALQRRVEQLARPLGGHNPVPSGADQDLLTRMCLRLWAEGGRGAAEPMKVTS
jgi:adenylate cyclase